MMVRYHDGKRDGLDNCYRSHLALFAPAGYTWRSKVARSTVGFAARPAGLRLPNFSPNVGKDSRVQPQVCDWILAEDNRTSGP